jgi:hypothetical protein
MNDTTAQMGFQVGKNAMAAGQEYMEKNVRITYLDHLPQRTNGNTSLTAT